MIRIRKKIWMMLLAGFVAISLLQPTRAEAQCEQLATAVAQRLVVKGMQSEFVKKVRDMLANSFLGDITEALTSLRKKLLGSSPGGKITVADYEPDSLSGTVATKLDDLSGNWMKALKDKTKQLHASEIDRTRQELSNTDPGNQAAAALVQQRAEYEAKKTYQPNVQGCQFDTTARYMTSSNASAKAVMTGIALDFNQLGNNTVGTPAAGGKSAMQKARWAQYKSLFCDPTQNNGAAGCGMGGGIAKNMDISPSRAIFAYDTIDLANPATQTNINTLLYNITGYEVPEIITKKALDSPIGLAQRQVNREYVTQMDVAGALAYAAVAERAPGIAAPEIKARAQALGMTTASANPSQREIRKVIVAGTMAPDFFQSLYDAPTTIGQKELYLKAYNLSMLYDLIYLEELNANAVAVQTANMLKAMGHIGFGTSKTTPFDDGGGTPP